MFEADNIALQTWGYLALPQVYLSIIIAVAGVLPNHGDSQCVLFRTGIRFLIMAGKYWVPWFLYLYRAGFKNPSNFTAKYPRYKKLWTIGKNRFVIVSSPITSFYASVSFPLRCHEPGRSPYSSFNGIGKSLCETFVSYDLLISANWLC